MNEKVNNSNGVKGQGDEMGFKRADSVLWKVLKPDWKTFFHESHYLTINNLLKDLWEKWQFGELWCQQQFFF